MGCSPDKMLARVFLSDVGGRARRQGPRVGGLGELPAASRSSAHATRRAYTGRVISEGCPLTTMSVDAPTVPWRSRPAGVSVSHVPLNASGSARRIVSGVVAARCQYVHERSGRTTNIGCSLDCIMSQPLS